MLTLTLSNLGNGLMPGTITPIKPGTFEQWAAQRRGLPVPLPMVSIPQEGTLAPLPQLPPASAFPQPVLPPPLPRLPEPAQVPSPALPARGQPLTLTPYALTPWHPQSELDWQEDARKAAAKMTPHRQEYNAVVYDLATRMYEDARKRAKLTVAGTVTSTRISNLNQGIDSAMAQMEKNRPADFPYQVWGCDLPGYAIDPTDIRSYDRGVSIRKRGKAAYYHMLWDAKAMVTNWAERDFRKGPSGSNVYNSARSGIIDALRAANLNPSHNPGYRLDWNEYQALVAASIGYAKANFMKYAAYSEAGYYLGPVNIPGMFPDAEWLKQVRGHLHRRGYKEPEKPPELPTAPAAPVTQIPSLPGMPAQLPSLPAFQRAQATYTVEQAAKLGASAALTARGLPQVNAVTKQEVYYRQRGMIRETREIQVAGPAMPVDDYRALAAGALAQAKLVFQQGYGDLEKVSEITWKRSVEQALKARHYRPIYRR